MEKKKISGEVRKREKGREEEDEEEEWPPSASLEHSKRGLRKRREARALMTRLKVLSLTLYSNFD